jgi:hypothetical protein
MPSLDKNSSDVYCHQTILLPLYLFLTVHPTNTPKHQFKPIIMSSTRSFAADTHSHPAQSSTTTSRLVVPRTLAPRTLAEYEAAKAHAVRVFHNAASLPLGFQIWQPGAFAKLSTAKTQKSVNYENNENIAIVSCHGNEVDGYNFSFHVSGATHFSQPGKETGNVLTFAKELVKILQDKSEGIEIGARYAARTLDRPLGQRERNPHDRQAAVKVADLLGWYYNDSRKYSGPADEWTFYGTEKDVGDLVSKSMSQSIQLQPNLPRSPSATKIDLHPLSSLRDRDIFVGKMRSTSKDLSAKVMPFPVGWTVGSKSFTLMPGPTGGVGLSEEETQGIALKQVLGQDYRQSSTAMLSSGFTGRTIPSTTDGNRGSRRNSRSRPRMLSGRKPAEASTGRSQLPIHNPTTSAPLSINHNGQSALPPFEFEGFNQLPSVSDPQFHAPQSAYRSHSGQNSGNISPAYHYNSSGPSAAASPGLTYVSGELDFGAQNGEIEDQDLLGMLSLEEQAIVESMFGAGSTAMSWNNSDLNGFQSAPGLPFSPAQGDLYDPAAADVSQDNSTWQYQGW